MENEYLPIVESFFKNNPKLYKESTPAQKAEIARNLAKEISSQVQWATHRIAEQEFTPEMDETQRYGILNMARLRAEELALNNVLYELLS